MVERDDDRPSLVALVDPLKCVSCGICAGSCAPMGVGPPGRTGRDQLALLRSDLADFERPAKIVAICCAQAPSSHIEALGARGAQVRTVSCVGNLHSSVVELLIRDGAPGVIVFGCPPRDCAGREGPKWLAERLFNEREAELQERVDRRRVRVGTLARGGLAESLAAYDAFAAEIDMLKPPAKEDEVELDLVCDPEPVEVEA
jgi:coenzyme F420-reducing hydrogenase delta subunit